MRNPKIDKLYPVRVWLLDIFLIAPLAILLGATIMDRNFFLDGDNWVLLILFAAFGMFYSLPTLAITYLAFNLFTKYEYSKVAVRVFCCAISIIGIVVTFLMINGSEMYKLMFVYSVSTIASFIIRKLEYC